MLKKTLAMAAIGITASSLSICAFADEGQILHIGPTFGFQLGYACMKYRNGDFAKVPGTNIDNKRFAGRLYGGYSFTDHLGLQLGYTYFGAPTLHEPPSGLKEDFTQQGIDLSGILSLTFDYGLGFYLKAGDTVIHRSEFSSNQFFVGHKSSNKNALLYGFGLTYDFDPAWSFEIAWTQITSSGDLPRTDFYTAGLNYRIGVH